MHRIVAFTLAVLMLGCTAHADSWAHRHKRLLIKLGVEGGAVAVGTLGLRACRSTGVEKCTAHYGAAWATFGFGVGVNTAMILTSESCETNGGGAVCKVMGYGGSAAILGWGIHEWTLEGQQHPTDETSLNRTLLRLHLQP